MLTVALFKSYIVQVYNLYRICTSACIAQFSHSTELGYKLNKPGLWVERVVLLHQAPS